jgi:multidrug resistance efflux pump
MEETKVYAPIGGLIESRSISQYGSVSTSTAAFSISNQDAMAVKFNVSADGASSLSIGDEVTLVKGSSTYSAAITASTPRRTVPDCSRFRRISPSRTIF